MALSGSFTVHCKTSGVTDKYITFEWSATQSVANNTSTITWKLLGGDPDGGYVKAGGFYVKIDGSVVCDYATSYRVKMYTGTLLASGSKTISHNANGTKSFTVEVDAGIYNSARNTNGSQSFTLDTIPRKSTLTASNGTLGTAQTLTINRASSEFYHRIKYTCGDVSAHVTSDDRITGTSVSFTPPLSLAAQNTKGTSVNLTLTLYTYAADGTELGTTSQTITCAIPASVAPTISLAVSDAKGYATTYGGYIQNLSQIKVVITASGAQGSTITSYKATADGKTYTDASFTTGAIAGKGTLTISASVTDSRGRTATANKTITVLEYKAPTISGIKVQRCDANGNPQASGTYLKVTFTGTISALSNKNSAAYKVEYKKTTETNYGTPATLSAYAGVYSASGSYVFAADAASSYNVRITAQDAFTSVSGYGTGGTTAKLFSWLESGLGWAFGKVVEIENAFQVAWDSYFDKDVHVGGKIYDQYDTPLGNGLASYANAADGGIDADTTLESHCLSNVNTPTGAYYHVITYFYNAKSATARRTQIAFPYNEGNAVYHRVYNGGWGAWREWDVEGAAVKHYVYLNSDSDGTAFETKLDEILATMTDREVRMICFSDYPYLDGTTYYGHLMKHNDNYVVLTAHSYNGGGTTVMKIKTGGAWCPFEYENPPMAVAKEYRTTERWYNRPVYTKLLSYAPSSFTSQAQSLAHNISDLDIGLTIDVSWLHSTNPIQWLSLPVVHTGSTLAAWAGRVYWNGANITFHIGTSVLSSIQASTKNIFVVVKYTKPQ